MNYFTKEELKELLDCIHWKINEGQEEKLTSIVDKKIQSMIENYCEHGWVFYISPHGNAVRCNKCNKGIP